VGMFSQCVCVCFSVCVCVSLIVFVSLSFEKSEADKIVDGMEFGELCNEFECISSPAVEATARQLVRDILELREGNRALGTYAVSVKYKVLMDTNH